jgi:hypothetical protein
LVIHGFNRKKKEAAFQTFFTQTLPAVVRGFPPATKTNSDQNQKQEEELLAKFEGLLFTTLDCKEACNL